MKRYAVAILTFLSLVLFTLTLWHWVLSFIGETIRIAPVRGGFALASIDASDGFVTRQFGDTSGHVISLLRDVPDARHRALGFAYETGNLSGARYWVVVLPHWFMALVTAILPIRWWLLRRRRRDRVARGRCLGCGYDLRGSPERCPECGALGAPPPAQTPLSESAIIGR